MSEFLTVDTSVYSDWRSQFYTLSMVDAVDTNSNTTPDVVLFPQSPIKKGDFSIVEEEEQIRISRYFSLVEQIAFGSSDWIDQMRDEGREDLVGKYDRFKDRAYLMPKEIMDGLLKGETLDQLVPLVNTMRNQNGGMMFKAIPQLHPLLLLSLHKEGYSTFLKLNPVRQNGTIDPNLRVGLARRDADNRKWIPTLDTTRLSNLRLTTNPAALRFAIDYSSVAREGVVTLHPLASIIHSVRKRAA